MNRLTFLKSLCALAIAPAALLRVLARERGRVPKPKPQFEVGEYLERVDGMLVKHEITATSHYKRLYIALEDSRADGTVRVKEIAPEYETQRKEFIRVKVYDAKVPGGGE